MLDFKSAAEGSREHWEADDSDGSAASDSEENARSVQQGPGHVGAATGAESLLSAGSLASRASKMFDVGELEPQGSGLTPACGKPSKQLVQFAWRAANDSATSTGRRSPRPSATSTAWRPSGGCLETLWARRCSHARTRTPSGSRRGGPPAKRRPTGGGQACGAACAVKARARQPPAAGAGCRGQGGGGLAAA
eukprot:scaffold58369_cov51-Phaeocystis_antarctica.AAC.1